MLHLNCPCGETVAIPESFTGQAAQCVACGKTLRAVAGGSLRDNQEITARLSVTKGLYRVGEQFFLIGDHPVDIGKLPEKPIALPGTMVSRNHCRIIPIGAEWKIEDQNSTNGLFVNGTRLSRAPLKDGDVIRIGEYELKFSSIVSAAGAMDKVPFSEDDFGEYDLAAVEETGTIIPSAPVAAPAAPLVPGQVLRAPGSGPECPCCAIVLAPAAQICVTCGIKVPSGRPIATARGLDENDLIERTRAWLFLISFAMRIGLLPVASEAFGAKKARSVWVYFALTLIVSAWFLIINWNAPNVQYANLMLWAGEAPHAKAPSAPTPKSKTTPKPGASAARSVSPEHSAEEFHAYQLLTHALLHNGIMHFAGNMLFLLVFGLRVNELLGDLIFSIVYPVLAVAAALAYMASIGGEGVHPVLGASGAVMGLAGMYFVFFPVQRVHMVFWLRIYITTMFLRMFRMRGFWLLVLWIGFNDVLPMALAGPGDHVAHWAHLGGFMAGMAIALGLLIGRLATARGADLLSFTIGRHAWPLLGKPNQNLEAPIASPRRRIPAMPFG